MCTNCCIILCCRTCTNCCYPMRQHVYQLLCYPMPWHVCLCTDCCVILCHGMCASVLSYVMACVPTVVLSYAVACVLSVVILCCGTCAHVLTVVLSYAVAGVLLCYPILQHVYWLLRYPMPQHMCESAVATESNCHCADQGTALISFGHGWSRHILYIYIYNKLTLILITRRKQRSKSYM